MKILVNVLKYRCVVGFLVQEIRQVGIENYRLWKYRKFLRFWDFVKDEQEEGFGLEFCEVRIEEVLEMFLQRVGQGKLGGIMRVIRVNRKRKVRSVLMLFWYLVEVWLGMEWWRLLVILVGQFYWRGLRSIGEIVKFKYVVQIVFRSFFLGEEQDRSWIIKKKSIFKNYFKLGNSGVNF